MSSNPNDASGSFSRGGHSYRSQLGSWSANSPIAAAAIAQDAEDEPESPSSEDESDASTVRPTQHSMMGSYRRPSFVASGPRGAVLPGQNIFQGEVHLSKSERERMRDEERSLLRDNSLIPPKHARKRKSEDNLGAKLSRKLSLAGLRKIKTNPDEESGAPSIHVEGPDGGPSENTPLLGADGDMLGDDPESLNKKWEEAISAGMIQTTWQREAKVLTRYSRSLILTFILQYSLTMASIFTVGHIGKVELGAVSLASSAYTSLKVLPTANKNHSDRPNHWLRSLPRPQHQS
jgi:MATE family multidrug resistance protein